MGQHTSHDLVGPHPLGGRCKLKGPTPWLQKPACHNLGSSSRPRAARWAPCRLAQDISGPAQGLADDLATIESEGQSQHTNINRFTLYIELEDFKQRLSNTRLDCSPHPSSPQEHSR